MGEGKVVNLWSGSAVADPSEPSAVLLEILSDLLQKACVWRVQGVALAYINADNSVAYEVGGFAMDPGLIGALEAAKTDITLKMMGVE